MVDGEGCLGRWEHRGRPRGMEQRGGSYGTADALQPNSQMAFLSPANDFSHQQKKRQPREEETISTSTT